MTLYDFFFVISLLPSVVPVGFGVQANATAYYISFQTDIPLMTNILNYTVYLDLNTIGTPVGIFLSLARNDLTEGIFGFDNGIRTKDYFTGTFPDSYNVTGNIATFEESIFVRGVVPDREFLFSNEITLDFDINTVVLGSTSSTSFDSDSIVYATINQPPGNTASNIV